jgi:hypothetical protein
MSGAPIERHYLKPLPGMTWSGCYDGGPQPHAMKRTWTIIGVSDNSNTQTLEFSLRDPDGYYVTISAL